MKITIEITKEEKLGLAALALEKNTTPEKLVQQFVSEVTGSLRSNGSDERMYAEQWLNRTLHRWEEMTNKERNKMERLQSAAYSERRRRDAAWRVKHLIPLLASGSAPAAIPGPA